MDKKDPIETFVEFTHMTDDKDFLVPIIKIHIGCSKLNYQSMITIANVEEVKHGKWERPNPTTPKSYTRICSRCKGATYVIGNYEYPRCPWCGAFMNGGDDDAQT